MSDKKTDEDRTIQELKEISWAQLLTDTPPGAAYRVMDMVSEGTYGNYRVLTPEILLYCRHDKCGGDRLFEYISYEHSLKPGIISSQFLIYRCKNCEEQRQWYAMLFDVDNNGQSTAVKLGQWPLFGPKTPARLITLIGPDRDLYLQGRRAENLGMGLGAYAYYRRVVENQRDRILDQIISAAERLNSPTTSLAKLREAAAEQQFSKSLEIMKSVIPEALRIKGHNPLGLLHNILSRGIHAKNDAECLELAGDIRTILTELANRIGQALKDQSDVDAALDRILNSNKSQPSS